MGHLGTSGGEPGQELVMLGLEVVGPGEQHPGESTLRDVAAVGVRAPLADVLVQEVETAREPEGLDLFEEVQDGDGGVLGPAFAQVLAIGIDEAGAVLGDTCRSGLPGHGRLRHRRGGPCLATAALSGEMFYVPCPA